MNKEESRLNQLVATAQRQRLLRDELLARQQTLAREVATADTQQIARAAKLTRLVATLLLLAGPSMLMSACVSQPDGRDVRTALSHAQLIENANQAIANL